MAESTRHSRLLQAQTDVDVEIIKSRKARYQDGQQQILGKILAGEISKPRSVSFKTFDIIKNFSHEDAVMFSQICTFAVNDDVVLFHECNLFHELAMMEEHGIIRFPHGFMMSFKYLDIKVNETHRRGIIYGDYVVVVKYPSVQSFCRDFSGYALTKSGKDLYRTIHTVSANDIPDLVNAYKESLNAAPSNGSPTTAMIRGILLRAS